MYKGLVLNLVKDSIEAAQKQVPSLGTESNPLILGNVAFWIDDNKPSGISFDTSVYSWDIPAWTKDVMYWIRRD